MAQGGKRSNNKEGPLVQKHEEGPTPEDPGDPNPWQWPPCVSHRGPATQPMGGVQKPGPLQPWGPLVVVLVCCCRCVCYLSLVAGVLCVCVCVCLGAGLGWLVVSVCLGVCLPVCVCVLSWLVGSLSGCFGFENLDGQCLGTH